MLITDAKIEFSDQPAIIQHVSIPEKCPHCGKNMSPRIYSGFSEDSYDYWDKNHNHHNGTKQKFCIVLQCVLCNSFYLGNFKADQFDSYGKILNYGYIEVSYIPPISNDIPENVSEISERFSGIYNQSLKAKEYGLTEIYGMGLRKSLEFLVKDFAIYLSKLNSDDSAKIDSIKAQSLGQVISSNFREFSNFSKLFQSASWIGNDETHYVRKHPEKDAEFLNSLIKVLANNVSNTVIEQEAMKLVDDN
ncbi:hypothetical protein R55214_HHFBAMCI_01563 [Fructobacillus evanidus]|uniref:DUF4145 domain-containing protein n=1 Tax=Fructobacillus evanidus TaxID=3064281 RepID=A0ABN9Z591_9LACO|nr:hypothetical protein R55250_KEHBDPNM_00432 [Fructobacillus sp. LMG 32999]CAK1230993.1 hypothetical protein R53718_MFFEMHAI_00709 [Fructobacillus sp. LMG 32999]CAK1243099.1 hypothetical protein R53534_HOPDCFKK_00909 [Fructobacillus sp. LMG 32999]CAK1254445.1 hypothetical protein R55234_GCHJJDIB_01490 [Fructobacillus sp. LMG 32999]CAK1254547.1 hypothetical protein R55214_HHFBAMCI_01563 [Fructobacillus sp. LMG 32999]